MAKKLGKFLLFTAAVGSVAAAVFYYLRKKDTDAAALEDEDYDDFSEDPDEDAEPTTNYVPLTPDTQTSDDEKKEDTFVPLEQVARNVDAAETSESDRSETEVEEFFDEEDPADKEPPMNED